MDVMAFRQLSWRLLLATEVGYVACLAYGFLLPPENRALHHDLFGLLLGFSWTPGGMLIGALQVGVLALIWAGVWAWLHNASLVTSRDVSVSYHPERERARR